MFYITPGNNTCFNLEQILAFHYYFDEETKEIDKTCLVIIFKANCNIKLKCKTEEIANKTFCDLCKYLNAINIE